MLNGYDGPYFPPPWQIGSEFGVVSEKTEGWFAFQDMLRIEKPDIWKMLRRLEKDGGAMV